MTHKYNFQLQHLINIEDLTENDLLTILKLADQYLSVNFNTDKIEYKTSELLKNKSIFNLFFEPSTRTRATFELAAKNLSANVININLESSSIKKGESIKDTILTIKAMQADCIVVRHKESGIAKGIAELCKNDLTVINAGDGTNAHPTQALLDVYTILKYKKDIKNIKVAIIGDVLHSRVARSQIAALKRLGCNNIHIIGPENLLPRSPIEFGANVTAHNELKSGIKDADVISVLRQQKERMQHTLILNDEAYFQTFGVTAEILKLAKPDAIVLHPGPINRNVEISNEVADGPQSVILKQVTYGVAVRMAVFELFLTN